MQCVVKKGQKVTMQLKFLRGFLQNFYLIFLLEFLLRYLLRFLSQLFFLNSSRDFFWSSFLIFLWRFTGAIFLNFVREFFGAPSEISKSCGLDFYQRSLSISEKKSRGFHEDAPGIPTEFLSRCFPGTLPEFLAGSFPKNLLKLIHTTFRNFFWRCLLRFREILAEVFQRFLLKSFSNMPPGVTPWIFLRGLHISFWYFPNSLSRDYSNNLCF